MALKADGTLWAWGNNGNGQHGDGTSGGKPLPTQTGTESAWKALAGGGAHVLAIKSDGSLWAWGFNGLGALGDGTATGPVNNSRYEPEPLAVGESWSTIAAGLNHSLAIRSDGTLWVWGQNISGQVGDGTTNNIRAAPTRIGADNSWRSVAGGVFHTLAAKADGTIWGWGFNGFGQLGDGTTLTRLSPVLVAITAGR
jgi:alpha-tubulin suppressor-like RCC1 family protein